MIQNMYTIYDVCAKANLTPFFLPNDAMATRTFTQCINDPDHAFSQAPKDYVLYKLGSFDNEQSSFEILNPPETIIAGNMAVSPAFHYSEELPQ